MCDSWKPGINNLNNEGLRDSRMLASMKDVVSEYSDEKHGMILMMKHIKEAAEELHGWHAEKARDLSNLIANLELMS